MANRLNVAEAHSIVALYERGWSCRRIGRELGIDRETVGNYVRAAQARAAAGAKPAKAPIGSGAMAEGSKPAKAPLESGGAIDRIEPSSAGSALLGLPMDPSASSAGEACPGRAVATEAGAVAEAPRTHSTCRPYHATILAKLEQGLKGHQFASLEEENRHLWHWEATVADTRIHGTIHKQVKEVFEQVERPALRPLPAERFSFFHEAQRIVHRDGHVSVEKAYYSVPPEYLGRTVWARWDGHLVRIFDGRMQLIATHARKAAGQFSTQDRHILDRKIAGVERGATWLLQKAGAIGTQAQRWAEAMVQARGVEGVRVLQGLVSLGNKHSHGQLDRACGVALEHQCFRLRTLRRLVRRDLQHADRQQELPGLLDEHPIIRPLADYGRFVHQAFLQPQPLPGKEIRA